MCTIVRSTSSNDVRGLIAHSRSATRPPTAVVLGAAVAVGDHRRGDPGPKRVVAAAANTLGLLSGGGGIRTLGGP
jgi:hypothetical protein